MRKKITIIENDKTIAKMYRFKLENAGFDIDIAHSGPAGLYLVKNRRPHLVLLDLRLPHMNGDEILRHIRQNEWGKAMKVIITANVSRAHAPEHLELLEYDKYLIKAHYTPGQLLDLVHETLYTADGSTFAAA